MSTAAEPAIKSYFFDKGYRDLWATIQASWQRNLATCEEHFAEVRRLVPGEPADTAQAVFRGAAGVSVVVFGTAVFVLASVVHVLVLGLFFLLIYVAFTLVYLTERGYLLWRRFFTACPACHEKAPLPEYFCPKCKAVHRRLVPSSYGILRHTCTCGERLPATFFLQRGELTSRCPSCHEVLEREHTETKKLFLPIVGGPAAGKSAYLFAVVRRLIEVEAPNRGLSSSFVDAGTKRSYQAACSQLDRGQPPAKTIARLPRAFNLSLAPAHGSERLLYLYDPAGEAFGDGGELILHKYQGHLSSLLFLVDPFAIPAVREEYRDRLPAIEPFLKPSHLSIKEALERVLLSLESHYGLSKLGQLKAPLAVVVTKIDAFDLERRLSSNGTPPAADGTPVDPVRHQLLRWDQADFVQQVEARFRTVRYFACSALGRMPNGDSTPFEPSGVLEPLVWSIESSDRSFLGRKPIWRDVKERIAERLGF